MANRSTKRPNRRGSEQTVIDLIVFLSFLLFLVVAALLDDERSNHGQV